MAGSETGSAGTPARRGPVFDLPPAPQSRQGGRSLVRIVAPAGHAVAWIDPDSARCLEFMVRSPGQDLTAWRPVFAAPDAQEADRWQPQCGVFAVLDDPSPGMMGAAVGEDRSGAAWRLLQRDPTSVMLQAVLHDRAGSGARSVSGRLTAQVDDATLSLSLAVRNDGVVGRPVVVGLRAVFPPNPANASRPVLVHEGGRGVPHHLPADKEIVGLAGTGSRAETETPAGGHRLAFASAAGVVVTCDEGVQFVERHQGGGAGSLVVTMLGAPPGQPVLLLSGTHAHLAISMTVLPADDVILK